MQEATPASDFPFGSNPSAVEKIEGEIDRGRAQVILLTYCVDIFQKTLAEYLKGKEKEEMILIVDYNGDVLDRILSDQILSERFRVFTNEISCPGNCIRSKLDWMGQLILTPVLWSTLGVQWNKLCVTAYCKQGANELPVQLLRKAWKHLEPTISGDVERIVQNPALLMCIECGEDCTAKDKPWHLNVSRFSECQFKKTQSFGAIDEYFTFDHNPLFPEMPCELNILLKIRNEGKPSCIALFEALARNETKYHREQDPAELPTMQ